MRIILANVLFMLMLVGGVMRAGLGLWIALSFRDQEAWRAANERYLMGSTSGEAITSGFAAIGAAILLGLAIKAVESLSDLSDNVEKFINRSEDVPN